MRREHYDSIYQIARGVLVFVMGVTSFLLVEIYSEIKNDIQEISENVKEISKSTTQDKERIAAIEAKVTFLSRKVIR